jgi:putative transposase
MKNKLLFHLPTEMYWRVLYSASKSPAAPCWLLVFNQKVGDEKIKQVTTGYLKQLLKDKTLKVLKNDPFLKDPERPVSEKEKQKRDQRWNVIKEFIDQEPIIYRPGGMQQLMQQKEVVGYSTRQISRLFIRYWKGGFTPDALLADYRNCGNKGVSKINGKSVFGKNNKYGGEVAVLSEQDIVNLAKGYREFYLKKKIRSQEKAYYKTLNAFFIPKDKNIQLCSLPSLSQFRYHGKKGTSSTEQEKLKAGPIIFNKDKRINQSNSNKNVFGVGALYQIDSTVGDVHLISSLDHLTYIGRPTLYLIVDVFSRLIVGMALEVENASFHAGCLAILNAAEEKEPHTSIYKLDMSDGYWPSQGIPKKIIADRAEFLQRKADALTNNLGIEIENKASYRPDLKGIVESLFKTVQERVKYDLEGKGAVESNLSKRISRDTRKDATLTLQQLRYLLIEEIKLYNNFRFSEEFPLTKQMILDKVVPTPRLIWDWCTKKGLNFTRTIAKDNLRKCLLPSKECSLNKNGVRFLNTYYSTSDEETNLTVSNLLFSGINKVTISYDPFDLGHVFLQTPQGFMSLHARSKNHLQGVSIYEQEFYLNDIKKLKNHFKKKEEEARLKSAQQVEKFLKSIDPPKHKIDTNNVRVAREVEKISNRARQTSKIIRKVREPIDIAEPEYKRKEYDELDDI